MYAQEKIKPYEGNAHKREQVEQLFDNIAPTYDALNHTLSFGFDRAWRRKAIQALAAYHPQSVLDVATGTGDFALATARRLRLHRVMAVDISEGMMRVGREKAAREGLHDVVRFQKEDCSQLSFPDNSFDAVTVTFGVRNFENLDASLGEMHRVLNKGGHLVLLELSYPHNRFYTSGKQTSALFGAAYSYGMVGSIHFAQQYFDSPFEEDAYVKAFAAEHKRLKALAALAQKCEPCGVEIGYDPFFYTQKGGASVPDFAECIGRFGIPFATKRASVACLDQTMAKYADHETLMRYLAGGLILDGDAARMLCDRGYGKYLGVSVGDDVLKARPSLQYDLGALEIISDAYLEKGEGKETWCAHAYCPRGGGKWMEIAVTDPKTKIVSEGIDFRKKPITPTMTYFENALGGKVLVLSLTIGNNPSQALYNHRRQRILQRIVCKMADEYPIVTNAPEIYLIASKAKEEGDLLGMLTLINLCEDDAEAAFIHLPKSLLSAGRFSSIQKDGSLSPLACTREEDGIRLLSPISHLVPTYIVIEK